MVSTFSGIMGNLCNGKIIMHFFAYSLRLCTRQNLHMFVFRIPYLNSYNLYIQILHNLFIPFFIHRYNGMQEVYQNSVESSAFSTAKSDSLSEEQTVKDIKNESSIDASNKDNLSVPENVVRGKEDDPFFVHDDVHLPSPKLNTVSSRQQEDQPTDNISSSVSKLSLNDASASASPMPAEDWLHPLGTATVFLQSLAYMVELDEQRVPILDGLLLYLLIGFMF